MNGDPLFDALQRLPHHAPGPRGEARVRAACHQRIQARAKRQRIITGMLQGATAAALCGYLASVLSMALRTAIGAAGW
jgi:hypothetical protein